MRRSRPVLIACLLLAPLLLSCRRRVPGTCADHVDCDPGFDCVDRRCARRAAVGAPSPGSTGSDGAAVASPEPVFPPRAAEESPPPPSKPDRTSTARKTPRPAVPTAVDTQPASAPGERLPLWQQRRKNF